MGFFKSALEKFAGKVDEESLYAHAAAEIANNQVSPGLFAKALAESDGETAKAQARYIKLRVDMLKAERSAIYEQQAAMLAPPKEEKTVVLQRVKHNCGGTMTYYRKGKWDWWECSECGVKGSSQN